MWPEPVSTGIARPDPDPDPNPDVDPILTLPAFLSHALTSTATLSTVDELLAIARKVADLDLMLLTDLPGIESLPAVRVLVVGFGAAWAGDDVLFGLGTPLAWAAEQAAGVSAAPGRSPLCMPPWPWTRQHALVQLVHVQPCSAGVNQRPPCDSTTAKRSRHLSVKCRRWIDGSLACCHF